MRNEYPPKRTSSSKKKLKLFGFELDPYVEDESVNSSSTTTSSKKETPVDDKSSIGGINKKCQYCMKEFVNSQALGGHQNAHKKERLKKKRLQLQARRASINYYLQPYQNNLINSFGTPLYIYDDPSCYSSEESNISFCPLDERHGYIINASNLSDCYYDPLLPGHLQFQHENVNNHMFTLTRAADNDKSSEHRPNTIIKSSPRLPLDLELGLSS